MLRQRTGEPGQRGDGGGIGRDPAIAGGLAVADAAAGGVEQQGGGENASAGGESSVIVFRHGRE